MRYYKTRRKCQPAPKGEFSIHTNNFDPNLFYHIVKKT